MITLDKLKVGQHGIICSLNIDAIPLKLIDMGCTEGSNVEIKQIAPLGDPIYMVINDSHISIRKELAKEISVELI